MSTIGKTEGKGEEKEGKEEKKDEGKDEIKDEIKEKGVVKEGKEGKEGKGEGKEGKEGRQLIKDFDDDLKNEPLFRKNDRRFLLHPITQPEIWKMYEKSKASLWYAEKIQGFAQDRIDWETKLNAGERHFISMVLAFFAASDGIVVENLAVTFLARVQNPEARCFYGFQAMMENIHSETYSNLINNYIKDKIERDRLFNAIENVPSVKKKAEWAIKWIGHPSIKIALIAFAVVEGIFFSGSFCAIYWMRKRNLLPALVQANEYISKDEGMHCDFAVLLHSLLETKVPEEIITTIVREAVTIEKEFICESIPVSLIGMNADLMSQYIEYVADRLLVQFDCAKIYNRKNPFPWMEMQSLQGKTNQFEHYVTAYQKPGIMTEASGVVGAGAVGAKKDFDLTTPF